jgi:hypothetical protein
MTLTLHHIGYNILKGYQERRVNRPARATGYLQYLSRGQEDKFKKKGRLRRTSSQKLSCAVLVEILQYPFSPALCNL